MAISSVNKILFHNTKEAVAATNRLFDFSFGFI